MLSKQRAQIDAIDQKLVQLLEARLNVVEDVAVIKKEHLLPIFDEEREKILLAKVASSVDNSIYAESIEKIFKSILEVSKEHQKTIVVKGENL